MHLCVCTFIKIEVFRKYQSLLWKDHAIFKIYVLVYHYFNAPTHKCVYFFYWKQITTGFPEFSKMLLYDSKV